MGKTDSAATSRGSVKDLLGGDKVRASVMRVTRSCYYSTRSKSSIITVKNNNNKRAKNSGSLR